MPLFTYVCPKCKRKTTLSIKPLEVWCPGTGKHLQPVEMKPLGKTAPASVEPQR